MVGLLRYEPIAEIMREFYNRDSELVLSDTTQVHPLFQGPEDFIRAQVDRLVQCQATAGGSIDLESTNGRIKQTERQLILDKRPKGHAETVAVLGFHMTQNDNPQFSDDDMKRAYIRAGVRPPKVMAQALRDAKNKYDYLEPGDRRGTYRLSDHGDRFVRFDLPRSANA